MGLSGSDRRRRGECAGHTLYLSLGGYLTRTMLPRQLWPLAYVEAGHYARNYFIKEPFFCVGLRTLNEELRNSYEAAVNAEMTVCGFIYTKG